MSLWKSNDEESNWMSLSDMMTGLMVIFMFVAIAYMLQTQENSKELKAKKDALSSQLKQRDIMVKKLKAAKDALSSEFRQRDIIFEEFKATENALYSELQKEFKDDFKDWKVVLDKDLSIKFTNTEVLFRSGESDIRWKFKKILDTFLPRYFKIILQPKYQDKISEIRIEGHTDPTPFYDYDDDSYISNMILSQKRAVSVLRYFKKNFMNEYSEKKKKRLEFLVTANGLSYGRTLDDDKKLTFESKKRINNNNSRRVEFRIVTNSRQLVKKVLEQIEK